MALNTNEKELAENYTFQPSEVYSRIVKFYSDFMLNWNSLKYEQKVQYLESKKMSVRLINVLDKLEPYVLNLPLDMPDIYALISLSKKIKSSKVDECYEFAYDFKDKYSIKLGMYSHYTLTLYSKIITF